MLIVVVVQSPSCAQLFSTLWPASCQDSFLVTALPWWRGLCNSVKLWATLYRTTQDGWVITETSDKTWSTGEGNGKPLGYTYHENLMNCMRSMLYSFIYSPSCVAGRTLVSQSRTEPVYPQWNCSVPIAGPPGKSPRFLFLIPPFLHMPLLSFSYLSPQIYQPLVSPQNLLLLTKKEK